MHCWCTPSPGAALNVRVHKWVIDDIYDKINVIEAHCYALQCRRIDCEQATNLQDVLAMKAFVAEMSCKLIVD